MNAAEVLTAGTVRDVFLWPAMDARAANVEQQRLLYNPTPDPDSLLEHLELLQEGGRARASLRALVALCTDLSSSNSIEAGFELGIAGAADQLATDLRDTELNGSAPTLLTAKGIARRLRQPLSHLAQAAGVGPAQLVKDCATIADAIRHTPRLQLLSPAVAHELGRAKYELLCELVDSEKTRAAPLTTAGPAARTSSHGQA